MLTEAEKRIILEAYANRKMTIREIAGYLNRSYETIRMYLVTEGGYSNTKKVR